MKKVIIMVSILFISALAVLGYYFLDAKKNEDKQVYEINERQVDLVNSKALNNIEINDVIISNIRIEDNKNLKFNINATKTDLTDKIITVIFYNDYAKNPGIVLEAKLSDITKKDEVTMDILESYNNPSRLEFDLK